MSTATLDRALDGIRLATVDTSVWLAFLTSQDETHQLARHLFQRVADDGDPLCVELSVITATEAMVRPARVGPSAVGRMRAYLSGFPHATLVPVDLEVATTAATVRAQTRLRTPDALIVASALVRGAEAIVTNDGSWRERLAGFYPGLRWVGLYEHL